MNECQLDEGDEDCCDECGCVLEPGDEDGLCTTCFVELGREAGHLERECVPEEEP